MNLLAKAYSHKHFRKLCEDMEVNDNNVAEFENYAFISIIGTHLSKLDLPHYFKHNHVNVLNLEFDDLNEDVTVKGVQYHAMSENQAENLYKFIIKHLGKCNFLIHCAAGVSRSYAVEQFIKILMPDVYGEQDKPSTENIHVLSLLKRQHYYNS